MPRRRDTERVPILAWGSGSGAGAGSAQLMIICKHSRARALSVMSGKCRRSSTTPDSSPPFWQAWRIARAVTSSTANMGGAWTGLIAGSKQAFVPPCSVQGLSQPVFMLHRSNAECTIMAITITIRNVMGCKGGGHGQARAEAAGRGGIDPGRASGPLPGGAAGGHARRALPQAEGPAQPPAAVEGRRGQAGRAAGGRGATRAEQTSNAYELLLPDRPTDRLRRARSAGAAPRAVVRTVTGSLPEKPLLSSS